MRMSKGISGGTPGFFLVLTLAIGASANSGKVCLGPVEVEGLGTTLQAIGAPNTNARVYPSAGGTSIHDPRDSKVYLGSSCNGASDAYDRDEYAALALLGKAFSYTVDLSQIGCSCAATFYLVGMPRATQRWGAGGQPDFYCDANASDPSQTCAEVDIQEASAYSYHAVLHTADDSAGAEGGFGGGTALFGATEVSWVGPRDWTKEEYGYGASCIDTSRPFTVTAAFPAQGYDPDATGSGSELAFMKVVLEQEVAATGATPSTCRLHTTKVGPGYGTAELTEALQKGLTPVISTWAPANGDMRWMSGSGSDGLGPCTDEMGSTKNWCGDAIYSDFKIQAASEVIGFLGLNEDDDNGLAVEGQPRPPGGQPYCCFHGWGNWCQEGGEVGSCTNWASPASADDDDSNCGDDEATCTTDSACLARWCEPLAGQPSSAPTYSPKPSPHPSHGPTPQPSSPTLAPAATPRPPPQPQPSSFPTLLSGSSAASAAAAAALAAGDGEEKGSSSSSSSSSAPSSAAAVGVDISIVLACVVAGALLGLGLMHAFPERTPSDEWLVKVLCSCACFRYVCRGDDYFFKRKREQFRRQVRRRRWRRKRQREGDEEKSGDDDDAKKEGDGVGGIKGAGRGGAGAGAENWSDNEEDDDEGGEEGVRGIELQDPSKQYGAERAGAGAGAEGACKGVDDFWDDFEEGFAASGGSNGKDNSEGKGQGNGKGNGNGNFVGNPIHDPNSSNAQYADEGGGGGGGEGSPTPLGPGRMHVTVLVLQQGFTVVLAAEPSDSANEFKKRLQAVLGLPAGFKCKVIFAGHGKQVSGLKTLFELGVQHKTALQLELLSTPLPASFGNPHAQSMAKGGEEREEQEREEEEGEGQDEDRPSSLFSMLDEDLRVTRTTEVGAGFSFPQALPAPPPPPPPALALPPAQELLPPAEEEESGQFHHRSSVAFAANVSTDGTTAADGTAAVCRRPSPPIVAAAFLRASRYSHYVKESGGAIDSTRDSRASGGGGGVSGVSGGGVSGGGGHGMEEEDKSRV